VTHIDVGGIPVKVPKAYEHYSQEAKDFVERSVRKLIEWHGQNSKLTTVTVTRLEHPDDPGKHRIIWNYQTAAR
jgi:hypothetical protein